VISPAAAGQNGLIFDSRNPNYRFPTGAVPAGTAVGLSLLVPKGEGARSLSVWFSEDGHPAEERPLTLTEETDGFQRWTVSLTPKRPGLYWYTFHMKGDGWDRVYGKDCRNRPVCNEKFPPAWQITVYDPEQKIPEGWTGGFIYQIFPDRFFRTGEQIRPEGKEYATFRGPEELPTWQRQPNGDLDTTDFFGGNLKGIEEKLGYLAGLGVTALYLNPIFEAYTNHRYDTGNYEKIDPILGTEEDLEDLCAAARRKGIRIILDGVFSHTGDNSVYFNKFGRYPGPGAYQSQESPYRSWFKFKTWPEDYESWWGIRQLPEVDETNPEYREYVTGKTGILRRWLRAGADGWRFDVADELPDVFLDEARKAIKEEKPDALFLGEVWEDASNKEAYGQRRRYLLGDQLDSVMNYVLKEAVLSFILTGDGEDFAERISNMAENYPPCALHCAMNLIGTHDTPRILTLLTGVPLPKEIKKQVELTFSEEEKSLALQRLKLADVLLFTLPGIPSVYYGDEAGVFGGQDPLNRSFYPWGKENRELQDHVRTLGTLRKTQAVLKEGTVEFLRAEPELTVFRRTDGIHPPLTVAVNCGNEKKEISLPEECKDLLTGHPLPPNLSLPPLSAVAFNG